MVAILFPIAWAAVAKKREWKTGTLVAIEVTETANATGLLIWHRYICTVTDGALNYVAQYKEPLKAIVKDPVRFVIEGDNLIILDADGKERAATLWKRERASQ